MAYDNDGDILIIHGGTYKIYGKQKITLGSTLLINQKTHNIKEIEYINCDPVKRKQHIGFLIQNHFYI